MMPTLPAELRVALETLLVGDVEETPSMRAHVLELVGVCREAFRARIGPASGLLALQRELADEAAFPQWAWQLIEVQRTLAPTADDHLLEEVFRVMDD